MEKAEKQVPQDPDGNKTMHANLVVAFEKVSELLE